MIKREAIKYVWKQLQRKTILVLGCVVLFIVQASGQLTSIGGSTTPLQYSKHTYTVTMGSGGNLVQWNIYPANATRITIEGGTTPAYNNGTDYLANAPIPTGGVASIVIDFTGALLIDSTYQLVYREEDPSTHCANYSFLPFTLYGPFDVDLDPNGEVDSLSCPDSHMVYYEGDGTFSVPATSTTINYPVEIVNPSAPFAYEPGGSGSWRFDFRVDVVGVAGDTSRITSISYPGYTETLSATNYFKSINVDVTDTVLVVAVTYDDVPGVNQKINVDLEFIQGSYEEVDVDVHNTTNWQNEMTHTINLIPPASYIVALD